MPLRLRERLPALAAMLGLLIILAGLLAACGDADGPEGAAAHPKVTAPPGEPVTHLTIDAADYSFTSLDTVPAGKVQVDFTNSGAEPHHAQFARLNDGVTMAQFEAALREDELAAMQLVTFTGGPAPIEPGGTGQVLLDLPEGAYVLMCLVPSRDGEPHLAKGMIKSLTVTSVPGDSHPRPDSAPTISMRDFAFEFPATLPSGPVQYEAVNDGPQPHEVAIIKLNDGATVAEALPILGGSEVPPGPPPFEWVGGMQALSAGKAGVMQLDLAPGTYVAVCMVPDPATGKPHIALGMVKEFAVE